MGETPDVPVAQTPLPHIGFVGIGGQGGPMAERIVRAGYPLTVWARRPEAAKTLLEAGARLAPRLTDLGACAVIGICVVDDAGVRSVLAELMPALARGATIVIFSTIHPDSCKRIAEDAGLHGIDVVDAPVSGGGHAAAAGTLAVMAGGEADAVARVRTVIETFAGLFVHLGPLGSGQLAKLVNNSLLAANMAVADAARTIGAALGIDLKMLDRLIAASSGRSYGYDLLAMMPNLAAFDASGAGPLLRKDTGLLDQVARAAGIDPALLLRGGIGFIDKVQAERVGQGEATR